MEPSSQIWIAINGAFTLANLIIVIGVVWKLSSKLTSLDEGRATNFRELQELKAQVARIMDIVIDLRTSRRERERE